METFVFGYGSLVRRPGGIPCHLLGHRRAWNVAMDNRRTIPGYKYYVDPDTGERPPVHVAFLNIYPAAEGRVNGIAFPVTAEALDELDGRERNYDRCDVSDLVDVDGRVWAYVGSEAGRARCAAGRAAGTAVVAQQYLQQVRHAEPPDLPVRPLLRRDVGA